MAQNAVGEAPRRERRARVADRSRAPLPSPGEPAADRFERPTRRGRTGVHRLIARPRRFWHYFVGGLVIVALLTGAGILGVHSINASVSQGTSQPAAASEAAEQVTAEIDPAASVAVLNGTGIAGLEEGVAQAVSDNGWGQIGLAAAAAASDVQISAVFYAAPEDEAAALALGRELGGISIYQNDEYMQYGVQLVVLLGADYAGPGA